MSANEVPNLLFYLLVGSCWLGGAWNLHHYKKYKELKIENELLKFKLKECERQRIIK